MDKPSRPLYTSDGAVFFSGPWAKAIYLPSGEVDLHAAADLSVTRLSPHEGRSFKQLIGDKRARD